MILMSFSLHGLTAFVSPWTLFVFSLLMGRDGPIVTSSSKTMTLRRSSPSV